MNAEFIHVYCLCLDTYLYCVECIGGINKTTTMCIEHIFNLNILVPLCLTYLIYLN